MDKQRLEEWKKKRAERKNALQFEVLFEGIKQGDVAALSSAITLLESSLKKDQTIAKELIAACLPLSGKSMRIGITGVPGVGKSTFIETFGLELIEKGAKLAVLAVDPSSEKSGGSILGDKTRMTYLSQSPEAFIRPSAAGKSLGGVARKTRETIILCEAAGFDHILIETVGVGQSETVVHSMVDFFLLLMLAGAGDELQGIKRGVMEMADTLVITKADGDNLNAARRACVQYKNAMHLFPPNENEWIPTALITSAVEKLNIDKVVETIHSYKNTTTVNGHFLQKRKNQDKYWLHETISDQLMRQFYEHPSIKNILKEIEQKVISNKISPFDAADFLMELFKVQP
jgi:LAO/AO transport system kinase